MMSPRRYATAKAGAPEDPGLTSSLPPRLASFSFVRARLLGLRGGFLDRQAARRRRRTHDARPSGRPPTPNLGGLHSFPHVSRRRNLSTRQRRAECADAPPRPRWGGPGRNEVRWRRSARRVCGSLAVRERSEASPVHFGFVFGRACHRTCGRVHLCDLWPPVP